MDKDEFTRENRDIFINLKDVIDSGFNNLPESFFGGNEVEEQMIVDQTVYEFICSYIFHATHLVEYDNTGCCRQNELVKRAKDLTQQLFVEISDELPTYGNGTLTTDEYLIKLYSEYKLQSFGFESLWEPLKVYLTVLMDQNLQEEFERQIRIAFKRCALMLTLKTMIEKL